MKRKFIDFDALTAEDLNFIKIEGDAFIALDIDELETGVVINDCFECGGTIEVNDIHEWMKKGNVGELSTRTLKGMQTYTQSKMPLDMLPYFENALMSMKLAKTLAVARLTNTTFDSIRSSI